MSGKLFGSSRQLGSFRGPILEEDEEEFLEAPPSTLTSRVKPRLGKGLSMLLHSSASSKHHTAKCVRPPGLYLFWSKKMFCVGVLSRRPP